MLDLQKYQTTASNNLKVYVEGKLDLVSLSE